MCLRKAKEQLQPKEPLTMEYSPEGLAKFNSQEVRLPIRSVNGFCIYPPQGFDKPALDSRTGILVISDDGQLFGIPANNLEVNPTQKTNLEWKFTSSAHYLVEAGLGVVAVSRSSSKPRS